MQIPLTPLGVLTQTEESTWPLNEGKMSVHMTSEKDYYLGGEESACQKFLLSGRSLGVLVFSRANKHLNDPSYGLLVQAIKKKNKIHIAPQNSDNDKV